MRTKIALIVVLASFLAASALCVGIAGAAAPAEGVSTTPAATPPSTSPPASTCLSKVEHRHDSRSTKAKAGCSSSSDPADTEGGEAEGGETTTPTPSAGVEQGTTISPGTAAGGGQEGREKSVVQNQEIGGETAAAEDGGVSAPGHATPSPARNGSHRNADDGGSSAASASTQVGPLGSVPLGVSSFTIGSFEIPPLLLPVYQACGTQYGIPWEVLAAINKVETGFGTDLGNSSAGAEGWMQFLPSSWATYGVDADGDGRKNPYDPVDAICAAARLLAAAGGRTNLSKAIFSYNHADWYVHEVLADAARYESAPANLVSALTGITEDSVFPVGGHVTYTDDAGVAEMLQRNWLTEATASAATKRLHPSAQGIDIFARAGAPVLAVANGTIVKVGHSPALGRYMILQDAFGSRFTYADLGSIRSRYRVPEPRQAAARAPRPTAAELAAASEPVEGGESSRRRLYALPDRRADRARAALQGQAVESSIATTQRRLRKGAQVTAGTVLAQVGNDSSGEGAHINFSIQPDGSPKIDPKAILDAWRRGGAGAIYHTPHPLARNLNPAEVLLLSSEDLQRRTLSDRRLSLPGCEQTAVRDGQVNRNVLAGIEFLTAQGFDLAINRSTCAERSGFSVSIDRVDGVAVEGHQSAGEPPQALVEKTKQMQGAMEPQEVVSATGSGADAVISSVPRSHLIKLDFEPPQSARLLDGKAIAPINAPAPIQAMIAAANEISDTPYIWGGGHGSWVSPGYDCSGSVSFVLHAAGMLSTPLTSGALESWGQPGAGRWVTVYANAEHTYAEIAGLRWDTVGDAQGSGPRWHLEPPYPAGFVIRHPAGY